MSNGEGEEEWPDYSEMQAAIDELNESGCGCMELAELLEARRR